MATSMRTLGSPGFLSKLHHSLKTPIFRQKCFSQQQCRCLSAVITSQDFDDKSSLAQAFRQASKKPTDSPRRSLFRTTEHDPVKHTEQHHGLYYTVPTEVLQQYMNTGLHKKFYKMGEAFNECCIMVRQPATEIFQCLRASDMRLPVVRYIVYGRYGVGKSITMAHVIQHCAQQGWLILHIPWVERYVSYPKEIQVSTHNPSLIDTPVDSTEWLMYFQKMNLEILSQLKTFNTYTWTKREMTEAGSPMTKLIEFAYARPKYASDVMGAVLKEVRLHSSQANVKSLVAIDGANSLWQPTLIRRLDDKGVKYKPEEISVVKNLRKMLMNDWSGGAALLTVDNRCAPDDRKESYFPRYILDKEAIDWLEPHIPIHVQNYNDKEVHSCIEYFIDRKWIQRPEGFTEEGKKEILFLSSKNPLEIYNICSRW